MGLQRIRKIYEKLDEEKKRKAIKFIIRKVLIKKEIPTIQAAIKKDPMSWFAPYHFFWGMKVRNTLRRKGFGEDYFGIDNLDDIYVFLVEDAVKE